jgi:hypothetical protein
MSMNDKDFCRFLAKVDVSNDCWLWTASTRRDGYGQMMFRAGGKSVLRPTHRVSYEHFNGPIPDGAHVLHSCDVKRCVRPNHLRLGDHAENMRDAATRGLNRRSGGYTNLTPDERDAIRAATGSIAEIARLVGRSNATVWRVRNSR